MTLSDPKQETSAKADARLHLEDLYAAYAAEIYRWSLGMLGRPEDAEDAVQSIWVRLARDAKTADEVREPRAYVWTVARRHVFSTMRRRKLERFWTPQLEEDELPLLPADSGISPDERRDMAHAVAKLRPKLKAVVVLVGLLGMTLEEAAESLEIPRGTAASRYHAALQKLKLHLGAKS